MESRQQYERRNWFKVVLAVVFLIGLAFVYRDYTTAPVEWRAGRVVDKEQRTTRNSEVSAHYYISADVDGHTGRVSVGGWEYQNWQVGQACEVAFRHGRIMDYTFTDIRMTESQKGRGWWAF